MTLKEYFETAKGVGVLAYEIKSKFLVTFRIERILPLLGEGD